MNHEGLMILLDTNVLIDSFCSWHINSKAAKDLISCALKRQHTLLFPVHSIKDVFYVLRSEYHRQLAIEEEGDGESEDANNAVLKAVWSCIDSICDFATAVGADMSDIWVARKMRHLSNDLEDNLVIAAAQRADVDYIVTSDINLLRKSPLAAHAPQDMLAILQTD